MENNRWFRRFEDYLPEEITNAESKFRQYAEDLGRNIRRAGRILTEKATTRKGRRITIPVPIVGDYQFYKAIGGKDFDAARSLVATYASLLRTGGLVYSAFTGDFNGLLYGYLIPTTFQEVISAARDIA